MAQAGSPRDPVFITGATGFIGRRVIAALATAADRQIRCLVRASHSVGSGTTISVIRGDLDQPESYARALQGTHTVLHLAAQTGKARRADHFTTNRDGTATLLRLSREAGVERFINVSSIAATYEHKRAYHYADSKSQAEELVRSSGLRFVNVRPTLVLGFRSPGGSGLLKVATLPLVPLFGDDSVRVQPIHVSDVAEFLVSALDEGRLDNHDVDLGGPEILSMRELLARIRRAAKRGKARFVRLPGFAAMGALALVEPLLGGLLPLSAGQLSAFVNDSTVKATVPGVTPRVRYTLDEMIRDTVTDG
ncbi:MAG: SDR family oxidoreductase [Vicinamibacterales bacterium]